MIAVVKESRSRRAAPAWHTEFLEMLPVIRVHARFAFRKAAREVKEELIQEIVCNCLVAFVRLVQLGKGDLAFPGVLARFAVAQVRQGRRVGNRRNIGDALSKCAQQRKGFSVERLDHYDKTDGEWREVLIEDRTAGPAETAIARLDFGTWLRRLPRRRRRIAVVLASGERTGEAAKRFRVSAGRISQLRGEFERSWVQFQGELPVPARTAAAA